MSSNFLETFNGVSCVQALKVAKLIGIKNVTQFILCNEIDARKGGEGRSHPWYVTVPGAIQMLIKWNFGGYPVASKTFYDSGDLNDADRVCAVLASLEKSNPGVLELKPRGRKTKEEARLLLA